MSVSRSNATTAELMSREGEEASGHLRQALKGAARQALMWLDDTNSRRLQDLQMHTVWSVVPEPLPTGRAVGSSNAFQ